MAEATRQIRSRLPSRLNPRQTHHSGQIMVGVYPLPTGFITRLRTNPPPPRIASVNLPWYLSLRSAWVLSQERRILDLGAPLTTRQLADAERAGVVNPQRVRILCVKRI